MRKILFTLLTLVAMTACSKSEQKALVLYYSQTGTTQAVAEEIQSQLGADIERFDVVDPYTGDFNATIARSQAETAQGITPALVAIQSDLSKYDVIFLGYPIWFGTYAPPVKALLEANDFSGKTIVPFCTFGSGGLNTSAADLVQALPESKIAEGYGVRTARVAAAADELNRFLIENGYKEGKIKALPKYSAFKPVTAETAAIFDTACSSYQFPLGTPFEVCSREVPGGMEYLFNVESSGAQSKIYVIALDGQAPEFTQVVR